MIPKKFEKRYLFQGTLTLQTGLHIGGRETILSPSEHPVIRTPDGRPFIPGSSFKGAFRSTVEKLSPNIAGIWSCGLDEDSNCVGPQSQAKRDFDQQRRNKKWVDEDLLAKLGEKRLPHRRGKRHWQVDEDLLAKLGEKLCHTCQLFGSSYAASKITFADLYLAEEYPEGLIQIRDGVSIDRDSGRAVDGRLFEYEVVAPSLSFKLEILLEDPSKIDLGLTCLGLSEFMSGFGYLGGKRSRGLGKTKLEGLQIFMLDLSDSDTRNERFLKYLTHSEITEKMDKVMNADNFIKQSITGLFNVEAPHA